MHTLVAFLLTLAHAQATISEAALDHRRHHLARILELKPGPGEVGPGYRLDLEILRDWQARDPEHRTHVDEAVARVRGLDQSIAAAPASVNPRPVLDARDVVWRDLKNTVAEYPWSTFRWNEVFAGQVAAMEVRVAKRLGVDVARVQQLLEHALPTGRLDLGYLALIDVLGRELAPASVPLYQTAALDVLYEEAGRVSAALRETLERANSFSEVDRAMMGRDLVNASRVMTFVPRAPTYVFLPIPRKDHAGQPVVPARAERAGCYARSLAHLRRVRDNLSRLGDSPLREALARAAARLVGDMELEVASLPARENTPPDAEPRAVSSSKWLTEMSDEVRRAWSAELRAIGLDRAADLAAPGGGCGPDLAPRGEAVGALVADK